MENVSNNISIVAQGKERCTAIYYVGHVAMVAMSRCYDMDVCFDTGITENSKFDLRFTTNLNTLLT